MLLRRRSRMRVFVDVSLPANRPTGKCPFAARRSAEARPVLLKFSSQMRQSTPHRADSRPYRHPFALARRCAKPVPMSTCSLTPLNSLCFTGHMRRGRGSDGAGVKETTVFFTAFSERDERGQERGPHSGSSALLAPAHEAAFGGELCRRVRDEVSRRREDRQMANRNPGWRQCVLVPRRP
jgi:hypothetical protein